MEALREKRCSVLAKAKMLKNLIKTMFLTTKIISPRVPFLSLNGFRFRNGIHGPYLL